MRSTRKSYKVLIERDPSGAWIARVPSVPGCHTYGRTIEQARERIREALPLWVDDAARADLIVDIRMPASAREPVRRFKDARRHQARWQAETQLSLERAARALTKRSGLSLRDAADLLGISHQRVAQVLEGSTTTSKIRS